jgi:hypothetical protein
VPLYWIVTVRVILFVSGFWGSIICVGTTVSAGCMVTQRGILRSGALVDEVLEPV